MTKKNIIMPILVLVIICTVVAALLAGTNMLTKDKIKENNPDILIECRTMDDCIIM